MKKCLTILTLITLSYSSIAQVAHGRLTGTVTDEAQKGVEAATVSLLSSKDSSLQKMSVTDKSGNYSFENLAYGKYLLSITAIGHMQLFSNPFEVKESNEVITMNPMVLKAESKSLSAVSVVARKPLIELKMDKTVVNVDAAVTNVGASALEVLEKSPGVTIDKDGNISLKGKQGVQVYID